MNYLAHLHLADHSEDALLGALLGDFVVGADLSSWAPEVQREIRLHRHIDSYTDAHPQVLALKALFPQGQRRFAGIAMDVYFDHLLARDWADYSSQPLEAFSQRVYALLLRRLPELPPRLQRIAPLMASGDWLSSYRQRASVDRALSRMAARLSGGGAGLVALLPGLTAHATRIEVGFRAFFPDLQREATHARRRLQGRGWP
ncbi:MAG: DUF479 domain-containing protein [Xanthomonadales bacterium]|nr:DUF479 domain-containing protein [Xanthomonadales bacterium]